MSAVRPCTTWLRFSFVDTCTVSEQLRSAASVTAVSGVAVAKLPPMPMKTLARLSRMARMASTVSTPCSRGLSMPKWASKRRQELLGHLLPDAHRAVTLDVGMSAHRAQSGAGLADHAAQQQDIGDLRDHRHGVTMLGQSHGPAHDGALRVDHHAGHPVELCPLDAGGLQHRVDVDRTGLRLVLREIRTVRVDELTVHHRSRRGVVGLQQQPAQPRRTAPCRRRDGSGRTHRRSEHHARRRRAPSADP